MKTHSLRGGWLWLLAMMFLFASCVAVAQSVNGELAGTVYDSTGAAVPNATVSATNTGTGIETTATSSATGQYRLVNLPVGTYDLKVSAAGFTAAQVKAVNVSLNVTSTINVTLQVGEAKTVVEVTGAAVTIDTTTAQVQSSFEAKQLADLPGTSTGSGVLNLALLTSGVSSSGTVGVGTGPSVGGQRPRNNNFTIEGIDNNSKSVTGPLVTIPNDAVAEFSILANQFSPEFGHSSGGQFNQIVKSGTNEFHGLLYEYLRNRNLDAADQQSIVAGVDPHPRYDNNRFGGTIGGPILKNKWFFFFNYEYQPIGSAGNGGQIFAPTTAGYAALASIPGISQNNLKILQQYLPAQSSAADPSATPNGEFPVIGGKTIQLGQYSFLAPNYSNTKTFLVSSDYTISDRDRLSGRFVKNSFQFQDTAAQLPVFWLSLNQPYYLATLTEYHTFAPSLTNEFRIGFNRYSQNYPVGDQTFPGLDAFPNLSIDELGINIGPDPNAPQTTVQNTYQLTDNVSWLKGSHTISFGADFKKFISPQTFTQRARGDYYWDTLDNYLQDNVPYFAERTTGNFVYYGDQIQFGAYVNDSWKVRQNFTVNLGVRYERTSLPYAERLQGANSISDVPGLITFREPTAQNLNFQPRIGLAWSPGKSGNTSIRAGFGMNYDQLFDNLGILSMPPQFQQTVDVGGNAGTNFLANGGIKPTASAGTLSQADARAFTGGYIPDQKLPKSIQWNFGIQRVWHNDYTIELRYLGSRGLQLPVQDRINVREIVTPSNTLPIYLTAPSQSVLDGLTLTQSALTGAYGGNGFGRFLPQYLNAGFQSNIVGFMPMGASSYHGLALQVTRRFTNGLQFVGSYTFSHNIDNSTAEVFSTVTTPRRQMNFQNLNADRSSSALDHRQRFTMAAIYDMPFFQNQNWFMKNIVGNWELAPVVTYETGTLVTVLSGIDANLNGDSAGDRAYINPNGTANIGTGTTALKNSAGQVVAFLANNPNARYIQAQKGVYPNGGRNTAHLNPIDDLDMTLLKRLNVHGENMKLEFGARFFNLLNHPQYTGGRINDVASIGYTSPQVSNFLKPTDSTFLRPDLIFSSNPRTIQIFAKFRF